MKCHTTTQNWEELVQFLLISCSVINYVCGKVDFYWVPCVFAFKVRFGVEFICMHSIRWNMDGIIFTSYR